MKLLINTATLYKGGGVQVALSFLNEIKVYKSFKFFVIVGLAIKDKLDIHDFPDNFKFYFIDFRPSKKPFSWFLKNSFFSKVEEDCQPDVVFTTSGPSYWKFKKPHLIGYNLPHYIYADSPFFNKLSFYENFIWQLRGLFIKFFYLRDASAIVVQTEDVKIRLYDFLKKDLPIFVVSNSCGSHYLNFSDNSIQIPKIESKDYFYVFLFSAYYNHKNFNIVSEIIKILTPEQKKSIRFVFTLEENKFSELFSSYEYEFLINLGPVNHYIGPQIYSKIDVLFLPTLLECFSATYVEAFAMNVPIITSDLSFAKSICKDAALYFNPFNAEEALNCIESIRLNFFNSSYLSKKGKERLKKFHSSEERAKLFLEICKTIKD